MGLADWTTSRIDEECEAPHRVYKRALEEAYIAYFASNPSLAGEHRFKASSLVAALPEGFAGLGAEIPPRLLHRHHLSGGSSQMVALGMLGAAARIDPSLGWLSTALGIPTFSTPAPSVRFEYEVDAALLREHPRVTTIDTLVDDAEAVLCMEAKLWEAGLGTCSCGDERAAVADCSPPILGRVAYWTAAAGLFGLPARVSGVACPISCAYQAIRCAAAARALAGTSRRAVFVLLYDERNPYFRSTGDWPRWPTVLEEALSPATGSGVTFLALSWQRLLDYLPRTPTWSHGRRTSTDSPRRRNDSAHPRP